MSGWIKVTGYVSNTLFEKKKTKQFILIDFNINIDQVRIEAKYIVLYGKLPRMFKLVQNFSAHSL